jgi:DNA-binding winged helix-turn-helix (wHTH) protein/tetratricopeptide (TPR) repeat protein
MASPAPAKIRFGTFELDVTSGELRKSGILLKLQPQPFRVLLLLIEKAGQVVTREEIQRCLWTDSTFVDFEHGINFSINQIRGALADNAERPRYIETLPKRGYRFIGTVARENGEPADIRIDLKRSRRDAELVGAMTPAPALVERKWPWKPLAVAMVFVVALAVGGLFFHSHKSHELNETDTIVLADFANSTGDPVFDDALKQAVSVQLAQSPFFNILSDQKVREELRYMGRSPNDRVTQEVAQEVCQRTGSKAFLAGSIAGLGSQYVIGLKALNCGTGDSLAQEQVEAVRKEDVLKALGGASTSLRRKLGESLSSIQRFDVHIFDATTPSLEALKDVSLGLRMVVEKGDDEALPFFKRAIELDPNFAAAYATQGWAYYRLGESSQASESFTRAYELRDRVSEQEKLELSADYYTHVTRDLEKANQILMLWARTYPRAPTPHLYLGLNYGSMGLPEKSLAENLEQIRLGGVFIWAYGDLMCTYISLNRLADAKAVYTQTLVRKQDYRYYHEVLYFIAFLEEDSAEMNKQLVWVADNSGEDVVLFDQSRTEAFFGHLSKAREFSRRLVENALRSNEKEAAAALQMDATLWEAEFGNSERARDRTASAMALASVRDVDISAALALARAGDSDRARKMAYDLEKKFPMDTLLNGFWLPTIRAAIEISDDNPDGAIKLLQAAVPYELAVGGDLYPVYVRGQAYLTLHKGTEAATEYQKFVDHRGIVLNSPLGALARLGLARAYAMQGDTAKAKAAYQDFLTLWKDADPDIPILKEAKAEYAKLQ